MTRYHTKAGENGETVHIPYTPQEEADRDAEEAESAASAAKASSDALSKTQFLAMQDRRAKALEAKGDLIGALLLRRKYEI